MSKNEVTPFSVADWAIFIGMLAVSAATGVYYAIVKGGQKTTSQYLVANRKLGCVPLAISYFVTFVSSIAVLGFPSEIFVHGIMFSWILVSCVLGYGISAYVFAPVIRGLDIVSIYEYIDLRFHYSLRIASAILFTISINFYMATTLVGPALAFQAVQNVDYWITIVVTGSICTFYTTLGGLKAVVWSDVFQSIVMMTSVIVVMAMATVDAGGATAVYEHNKINGRLNLLEVSPDPTIRITVWSIIIGQTIFSLTLSVNQGSAQRVLAAKSIRQAQGTIMLSLCILEVFIALLFLTGLSLYAYYDNNLMPLLPAINSTFSPLYNVTMPSQDWREPNYEPNYSTPDQILIYFVSSRLGQIPGLQGLFISCLFAGALSSISSGLNGLVAVILKDMILPWRQWRSKRNYRPVVHNDARDTTISKGLTVMFGIVFTALGLGVPYMGTFIVITTAVQGVFAAPVLGAFTLGMCYPRANTWGVFIAVMIGTGWGIWVALGATLTRYGLVTPLPFYKMSFMWYPFMNWFITVVLGILISEIRRCIAPSERGHKVDPKLLIRCLRPKYSYSPNEGQDTHEREVIMTEMNINRDEYLKCRQSTLDD
ncbi:sodium-dependent multivitamin transporter-like [Glandiceps talaboti]